MNFNFKNRKLYIVWFNNNLYSLLPHFRYKKNGYMGASLYFGKYVLRIDLIVKGRYRLMGRIPKEGQKWIGKRLSKIQP